MGLKKILRPGRMQIRGNASTIATYDLVLFTNAKTTKQ